MKNVFLNLVVALACLMSVLVVLALIAATVYNGLKGHIYWTVWFSFILLWYAPRVYLNIATFVRGVKAQKELK